MDLCTHPRQIRIRGKCSDMAHVRFPDGHETSDYMVDGLGLGGGDYIEIKVCIDCKVCIGLASADVILAIGAKLVAEQESS